MEQNLRVGENGFQTIGVVSEYDLTIKEKFGTFEIDGEKKTMKSATIYGIISVEVGGEVYKHNVLMGKHTKKGEEKKQFKGICTVAGIDYSFDNGKNCVVYEVNNREMKPIISGKTTIVQLDSNKKEVRTEYKFKGVGAESPTNVDIKGSLERDEYLNRDKSDLVVGIKLSANNISTQVTSTKQSICFVVEGYIKSIADEYDNNGVATGRKLLDLASNGFFGLNVFSFYIPKSWTDDDGNILTANDYVNFCKVGETITVKGSVEAHTYGAKKASTTGAVSFGNEVSIKSGYTITEFITKGADKCTDPALTYSKENIDIAINEYNIFLDDLYKKKLEYFKNKENKEGTSFGTKNATLESLAKFAIDPDDMPF